MSLLNRKVDYGLLILCDLHGRPEGGSAREVADRFGLSRPFVANILKRLCQVGLVHSHRGIKGGYALARPAEEVCLAEVMEALDAPFQLVECCRGPQQQPCGLELLCPVRQAMGEVDRRIREVLAGVSLADLLRPCPRGPATQFGIEVHMKKPACVGGES